LPKKSPLVPLLLHFDFSVYPFRDRQQDPPVGYCPRCGGEIYAEDQIRELDGETVHEECAILQEKR